MKKEIGIGTAGAGYGAELHLNALKRVAAVPFRLKKLFSPIPAQLRDYQNRYGYESITTNFDDLLNDPEIDVIDIVTPPHLHIEMAERALMAGKHVICEKPLSGYFGSIGDEQPIGNKVPKDVMYERLLASIDKTREIINKSGKRFMYAENFVYAPAIAKAAEIINKKKSRILYAKGEESLKGSSSPVAGSWDKTGGGPLIRAGIHPLTAVLWLKEQEAASQGTKFGIKSVFADVGMVTPMLTQHEHRHITANPIDVEDECTLVITFTDGTKAVIMTTDTMLGGSKNYVELYCNDVTINCNLTMSNMMSTYFLDEEQLEDVYISEMLPSKTGWNNPFLEDSIIRGYVDEMNDFLTAVVYDREPKSGFDLAYTTLKVVYAAYMSADQGRRIDFASI
jgi:predicted dehydrogenase